jgi:hypothetical protein
MRVVIVEAPPSIVRPPFCVDTGMLRILPMRLARALALNAIAAHPISVDTRTFRIIPMRSRLFRTPTVLVRAWTELPTPDISGIG